MFWHGGDVYGFSGTVVSLPEEGIFIAILTNNPYVSSRDLDLMARRAAAVLIGDPFTEYVRVPVPLERLEILAGIYRLEDGDTREVLVEDGRLYTRRPGGGKVEALPASPTLFFFGRSLTYLTFDVQEQNRVEGMTIHRDTGDEDLARKAE